MDKKEQIITALYAFIRQRPGLEFGNYGDVSAYRSEMRSITKDRHHAEALLRAVELSSITAEQLEAAFSAFSGRLTLTWRDDGAARLSYCAGQYWPTEYRRAVCAVCAQALWTYKRDQCMPAPDADRGGMADTYGGQSAGDWLRSRFRREFGASIAKRWFN